VCRADNLTTFMCADCLEIWEPQPPGTLRGPFRPVMGLLYLLPYLSTVCSCITPVMSLDTLNAICEMLLMKLQYVLTHRYSFTGHRKYLTVDQQLNMSCFYKNVRTSNFSVDTTF